MSIRSLLAMVGAVAVFVGLLEQPRAFGQAPTSSGLSRGSSTSSMFSSSATTSGAQSRTTSGTGSGTTGLGSSMTLGSGQGGQAGPAALPFGTQTGQGRTFVGASSGNVSNIMSMVGAGSQLQGQRGFANLQNLFNQSRQNTFNAQALQQNGQRGQGQSQTQIVVPIRLGFQRPPVSVPQFSAAFTQRLTKMPAFEGMGPIQVDLAGRTAILRGTVPSESDRRLAELLALLEPEVAAVQNELVVSGAPTTGEPLPPTPGLP